ncbi:MAG: putative tRNA-specific adenosine deaminase [Promethearchaeota archaeon]|nr:MAG: putative tRNA-specific adenosine deaminase [Candidatus Lokiarchaeota archaeon]
MAILLYCLKMPYYNKINTKIQKRCVKIAKSLVDMPNGKNKHFSFIFRRTKLLSIGWNNYEKTHPMTVEYGYRGRTIHSEMMALLNIRRIERFTNCYLVNVRINSKYELRMSKPCLNCVKLLKSHGIIDIYYTNHLGKFEYVRYR